MPMLAPAHTPGTVSKGRGRTAARKPAARPPQHAHSTSRVVLLASALLLGAAAFFVVPVLLTLPKAERPERRPLRRTESGVSPSSREAKSEYNRLHELELPEATSTAASRSLPSCLTFEITAMLNHSMHIQQFGNGGGQATAARTSGGGGGGSFRTPYWAGLQVEPRDGASSFAR